MTKHYEGSASGDFPGIEYVESDEPDKCLICGKKTHKIDLDFEAHVCSFECLHALWVVFKQASTESYIRYKNEALDGDPF